MNLHEKLVNIQQNLKAPKNQFNSFGKYHYRSCEDILEAVKPLLNGAILTITDDIVLIGDRYYVKAHVALIDSDGESIVSATAFAREEQDKKGMDGSQITGAASSYARKYALNGLFLIDDTKDADTQNNTKKGDQEPPKDAEKKSTPLPSGNQTIITSVLNVEAKKGEKKDGTTYTIYGIKGEDGSLYRTFSESYADIANTAKTSGDKVQIAYQVGKYGNNIVGIAIEDREEDAA